MMSNRETLLPTFDFTRHIKRFLTSLVSCQLITWAIKPWSGSHMRRCKNLHYNYRCSGGKPSTIVILPVNLQKKGGNNHLISGFLWIMVLSKYRKELYLQHFHVTDVALDVLWSLSELKYKATSKTAVFNSDRALAPFGSFPKLLRKKLGRVCNCRMNRR